MAELKNGDPAVVSILLVGDAGVGKSTFFAYVFLLFNSSTSFHSHPFLHSIIGFALADSSTAITVDSAMALHHPPKMHVTPASPQLLTTN